MADDRVSHVHVTVVAAGTNALVSHVHATVVAADNSSVARLSHLHVTAIVNASVNFEWIDMFIEERFPTWIRYTSEGGPGFATLQNQATSGKTQRAGLWDEELGKFNVGILRGAEDVRAVRNLFAVVKGPLTGFRFKDNADYSTALTFVENKPGPVTSTDQQFGVGDGSTAAHQLIVTRPYGASSAIKTIFKPVSGTVLISQDGILVSNYVLDYTTGLVTWTPRTTVTGTDISFKDAGAGNWVIRSTSTSWANFVTGESIRVSGSVSNDTPVPLGVYIITGAVPAGAGDLDVTGTLIDEGPGATVTVDVHPYPRTPVVLKWGGLYDKPVHALKDSFAIRHEEGEEGNIQSGNIQLEELRMVSSL
jgi:uncharacterized protein (TIGR02217 family)